MYLVPQLKGEEILEYLRKSQSDDPLLSVEEVLAKHEQMLDSWMERNQPEGGPVPEQNRLREVVSGETLSGRPRMMELLRRVESPRVRAVLCTEPARLSRGSLKEIGHIVEILRYTNTLVITLQYTYDLNDDRDRELFERELMRSQDYLQYQKKILANGRLASVAAGNYIGSIPPYGFRKVTRKEGKQICHTLEPIPEQAEVVKMIFEMYRDGLGTQKITDKLDEMHVPTLNGKPWSRYTLSDILENVHYLGKVRWGYRKTIKKVVDGQVVKSNPTAEDYLIFEGKHPAIIDQELWDAVQAIRGSHPRNTKAHNQSNPLAGLLWCKCGRAMNGKHYFHKDGRERCAPRFICPEIRRCKTASAAMDDVMAEIVKVLEAAIDDFEIRIESGTDDSAEVHRRLVERLEKRMAELKDLERKQWDEKIKGEIPPHVFKDLNDATVAEIAEVHDALCAAKDAVPEPIDLQEKVATFKDALAIVQDPEAPVKEVNRMLKKCIERIDYNRKPKEGNPRWGKAQPIELHFTLRV